MTFQGGTNYLEDFIARIDALRLNELQIHFLNQLVFDIPQLLQFITYKDDQAIQLGGGCL
jgi:hypothetical protein